MLPRKSQGTELANLGDAFDRRNAWDWLPGTRSSHEERNHSEAMKRKDIMTESIKTKIAPYLISIRRRATTIFRSLPGLRTMQFGIGM